MANFNAQIIDTGFSSIAANGTRVPYNSGLRSALCELTDADIGAHWLFNTGNDTCLTDMVGGKVMTPNCGATGVRAVTLGSGGSGYSSTPTVSLSGGGGSGATAIAIRSGSTISAIYITNPGTGYTSAPTVSLSGGGGSGASGTAVLDGRPTYNEDSLTIPAGGLNGLILPYDDQSPMTLLMVARFRAAGNFYGGSASNTVFTGDFFYNGAAGPLVLGTRSGGSTTNLSISGSSVVPDNYPILIAVVHTGSGRTFMLGSYTKATDSLVKGNAAVDYAIGRVYYKEWSAIPDAALEVHEVLFLEQALTTTELDAFYSRAKARQAAFGVTLL